MRCLRTADAGRAGARDSVLPVHGADTGARLGSTGKSPTHGQPARGTIIGAINGWIGQLFHPTQRDHTVDLLLAAQPASVSVDTDEAKKRRADADQRLRRYQAAIAAGVDPEAMIDAINQAQAERRAAQAEIDSTPTTPVLTAADMHAVINSLGDIGAAIDEARPAALARLYQALDLGVRYEPDERAAYVTARPRVDSACVRGGLAH